jgi:type 1 fimbria pilin
MKKIVLLPLALAFATNAALAANSVDLHVTGTITPAACNISLASGGEFNLGTINANDLAATTTSTLPAVGGQTMSITCSGATQVGFKLIDNRASSVPSGLGVLSGLALGLGTDSANHPIGYYFLNLLTPTATVDGSSAQFKSSSDAGATWNAVNGAMTLDPFVYAFDLSSAGSSSQPVPITSASTGLEVLPIIQPEDTLDTSSEITLDGSATIELVYL